MSVKQGNDIYITGIAGVFPESDSVKEFEENLFNKVDLITDDERRWRHTFPAVPRRSGKIKNINNFDASFFDVDYERAHRLDHMCRLFLERVYECLIDAGVNPGELRNTNTAVIVGNCSAESEYKWIYNKPNENDCGITGCSKTSIPACVSDWLGIYGPSYMVDTACSSSLYALEQGYKLIRDGKCDAAIIGGTNLTLNPIISIGFSSLGTLAKDGRCKSFDERGNGYGRSESIVAVFLQKAKDSRRVHAKMVNVKTNCDGYKEEGISYPAGKMQTLLLNKFYEEINIQPTTLEFVEAHSTGTRVGDPEELAAIDHVFCTGRSEPLLIGAVKSNVGHSEASSGLNSLVKLCIAYNSGYIPPNINYVTPRACVPALVEGRLKVVTEKTPWNRGLSSVSNFGFGGANAHVLLQNVAREKINGGLPCDDLPRLVCVSGRTESAVARILDDLESRPVDVDEIRLWHAIHEREIKGHHFRGFTLLESSAAGSIRLARDIQPFVSVKNRPVWFLYSDLGQHWSGMAESLMKIPIFADTLQRCQTALESVNFNLLSLFNCDNNERKNNFAFVGSTVVQIGVTSILSAVGIKPNHVISADNELCGAYVEGILTAEDTILTAYNVCSTANGSEIQPKLKSVLSLLKSHTGYTRSTGNCNLASSIATDTIVINIGYKLENSVLPKPAEDSTLINLLKYNMKDTRHLFTALGSLFEVGLNPTLANIYPEVEFPVAQSTPLLSHLVEWNHKESWHVVKFESLIKTGRNERTVQVSVELENTEYLSGHTIDGRVIYPATGYLVLVWETLAFMTNRYFLEVSVEFTEVYFLRATYMPQSGHVEFTISLHRSNGSFEVIENGVPIVKGFVHEKCNLRQEFREIPDDLPSVSDPEWKPLSSKDFYKELNLRGYNYKGLFRGVESCDVNGTRGSLSWVSNWVTFLDTMLQINIVSNDTRSLCVPTRIEKIAIDVGLHHDVVTKVDPTLQNSKVLLAFRAYPYIQTTRCGGVEIRGVHVTAISIRPPLGIPVYERNVFMPYYNNENVALNDALRVNLQLIHENTKTYRFKSIELVDTEYKARGLQPIIEEVGEVLADMPLIQAELLVLCEDNLKLSSTVTVANKKISSESNAVLFIGANLLSRDSVLNEALKTLKNECFILSRETKTINPEQLSKELDMIAVQRVESEYFILIRKKLVSRITACIEISAKDSEYSWISNIKECMSKAQKTIVYNQNESKNGLLGLVNCLQKEAGGENIHGVLIADATAPKFDPSLPFYKGQLDKQLVLNVYKNGEWGSYRHLLLNAKETALVNHAYINATVIGDLSSLRWLEGPLTNYPSSDENKAKVQVYCSALNFRDAMTATGRVTVEAVVRGRLAQECVQGIEVSGKLNNGTRVMAFAERGFSNITETDKLLTWCIPEEWSLAEAATVPVAYGTAYMAMVMVGKMRKGESILIHVGSGAVGQAAINLALHHGLEVFTTAGTPDKRAFLKRQFPKLKESHIGNSRDTSFEDMVYRETNGKGVDLVLNSLADDKLQASVKCLGQRGRFLEIGKYDVTMNTQIETCFLKKQISFHGVMLDYIYDETYSSLRMELGKLLVNGIVSGAVRPITYCVFEKEEVDSAFRYMTAGKHVGKIIIKIRDEEPGNKHVRPTSTTINAIPRYHCDASGVYVLVGGLGGFGLELADWLVLRGARKLLFSSRRGISNGYQSLRIKFWKSYGTDIQISTDDVSTEAGCESLLRKAAAMGPVYAIFNLAVILKDAIFQNQSPDTFEESFKPKGQTTIYLDTLSRIYCPNLRDFVVFSSVSCGRGNAGQTNYGFSNSFMERVCEARKQLGLPALAIQWGAIADVGLVADMQENNVQVEIGGTLQQRISSCIQAMDTLLKQDAAIVSSIVVAEKRSGGASSGNLVEVIAGIIGIGNTKTLSRQVPLSEMGMDSMMAVEIKQTLERDFEIFLSAQEIRMMTFAKLLQLSATSEDTPQEKTNKTNVNYINMDGLQMLNNNFGDEKSASLPFVYLPTLECKGLENGSANDKDNVLFLLPGLESCAEIFKLLCSQLKVKACVLQLGIENSTDDMEQITNRLYKTVKERLPNGAPFYLLGYSFGCLPIIELAAKLENEGHRGTVFCVDGSPEYTSAFVRTFLNFNNDHELQTQIIVTIFNILQSKTNSDTVMAKINSLESFEEKIETAIKLSPVKLDYSYEFLSMIARVSYRRLQLILNYNLKNQKQISSPIILLRQKVIPVNITCGESYGLDKITSGSVTVHVLDGDHTTILENEECAHIINQNVHKTQLKTVGKNVLHNKVRTHAVI